MAMISPVVSNLTSSFNLERNEIEQSKSAAAMETKKDGAQNEIHQPQRSRRKSSRRNVTLRHFRIFNRWIFRANRNVVAFQRKACINKRTAPISIQIKQPSQQIAIEAVSNLRSTSTPAPTNVTPVQQLFPNRLSVPNKNNRNNNNNNNNNRVGVRVGVREQNIDNNNNNEDMDTAEGVSMTRIDDAIRRTDTFSILCDINAHAWIVWLSNRCALLPPIYLPTTEHFTFGSVHDISLRVQPQINDMHGVHTNYVHNACLYNIWRANVVNHCATANVINGKRTPAVASSASAIAACKQNRNLNLQSNDDDDNNNNNDHKVKCQLSLPPPIIDSIGISQIDESSHRRRINSIPLSKLDLKLKLETVRGDAKPLPIQDHHHVAENNNNNNKNNNNNNNNNDEEEDEDDEEDVERNRKAAAEAAERVWFTTRTMLIVAFLLLVSIRYIIQLTIVFVQHSRSIGLIWCPLIVATVRTLAAACTVICVISRSGSIEDLLISSASFLKPFHRRRLYRYTIRILPRIYFIAQCTLVAINLTGSTITVIDYYYYYCYYHNYHHHHHHHHLYYQHHQQHHQQHSSYLSLPAECKITNRNSPSYTGYHHRNSSNLIISNWHLFESYWQPPSSLPINEAANKIAELESEASEFVSYYSPTIALDSLRNDSAIPAILANLISNDSIGTNLLHIFNDSIDLSTKSDEETFPSTTTAKIENRKTDEEEEEEEEDETKKRSAEIENDNVKSSISTLLSTPCIYAIDAIIRIYLDIVCAIVKTIYFSLALIVVLKERQLIREIGNRSLPIDHHRIDDQGMASSALSSLDRLSSSSLSSSSRNSRSSDAIDCKITISKLEAKLNRKNAAIDRREAERLRTLTLVMLDNIRRFDADFALQVSLWTLTAITATTGIAEYLHCYAKAIEPYRRPNRTDLDGIRGMIHIYYERIFLIFGLALSGLDSALLIASIVAVRYYRSRLIRL